MMHLTAALSIVSLLACSAAGLPIQRRHDNDVLVLKFADVLEQLETQFYTQALQKFQSQDFVNAGFADANVPAQQIQIILSDESTHATVLESVLLSVKEKPISGCSFNFGAGLNSVSTMVPLARTIEYVGVGAYLGAAHLISDPTILTAAASIATVEARHQTILSVLNGGTAIPAAFDLPLGPQEVLALAGGFISGCNVPGITALEALTVTNNGSIQAGTQLTFSSPSLSANPNPSGLSCQMLGSGMPQSLVLPFNQCTVPANLTGPVAIYVTNSSQPLSGNVVDRDLKSVVAGPALAILNGAPEALGNLVFNGTNANASSSANSTSNTPPPPPSSSNATTTTLASASASGAPSQTLSQTGAIVSITTQTISPEQASSIISNASTPATPTSAPDSTSTSTGAAPPPPPPAGSPSPSGTAGPSANGALTVNGVKLVPISS